MLFYLHFAVLAQQNKELFHTLLTSLRIILGIYSELVVPFFDHGDYLLGLVKKVMIVDIFGQSYFFVLLGCGTGLEYFLLVVLPVDLLPYCCQRYLLLLSRI